MITKRHKYGMCPHGKQRFIVIGDEPTVIEVDCETCNAERDAYLEKHGGSAGLWLCCKHGDGPLKVRTKLCPECVIENETTAFLRELPGRLEEIIALRETRMRQEYYAARDLLRILVADAKRIAEGRDS